MRLPRHIVPVLLALAVPAGAGETLVQVSTIDALIKGIYDGEVGFGGYHTVNTQDFSPKIL